MGGLGPADAAGNYTRPSSDPLSPPALNPEDLLQRSADQRPILVIGRSCPWAHRTWLVHQLRHLHNSLTLVMAQADHNAGRWALNPALGGVRHAAGVVSALRRPSQLPGHRACAGGSEDAQPAGQ